MTETKIVIREHSEGSGGLRPLSRCATALPKGEPLATPGWKARRFWCLHSREDASAAVLTKSAGFCDTGGGQRPPLQSKNVITEAKSLTSEGQGINICGSAAKDGRFPPFHRCGGPPPLKRGGWGFPDGQKDKKYIYLPNRTNFLVVHLLPWYKPRRPF